MAAAGEGQELGHGTREPELGLGEEESAAWRPEQGRGQDDGQERRRSFFPWFEWLGSVRSLWIDDFSTMTMSVTC